MKLIIAICVVLSACTAPITPRQALEQYRPSYTAEVQRPFKAVADDIRRSVLWCHKRTDTLVGATPSAWVHDANESRQVVLIGHQGFTVLAIHTVESISLTLTRVTVSGARSAPSFVSDEIQRAKHWAAGVYVEDCARSRFALGEYDARGKANRRE